jgi:RNA polymerase sigma factor (sigma-70 family)
MVSELSAQGAIPASVVEAAAAGDTMAFARIVQAHHDDMARVCQVICGDPDLAQDAVQAAWPIVWHKLRTLRDPDKLRPWLVTVAANEARQLLRKQHRERVTTLEVADVGSQRDDPAARAADTDLLAAIRLLPADDRTLLSLRYVAGFDATEIGAALGITPSGVRSRLSRLVDRLRTEIGNG